MRVGGCFSDRWYLSWSLLQDNCASRMHTLKARYGCALTVSGISNTRYRCRPRTDFAKWNCTSIMEQRNESFSGVNALPGFVREVPLARTTLPLPPFLLSLIGRPKRRDETTAGRERSNRHQKSYPASELARKSRMKMLERCR